jgi:hypothetical protein
MVQVDTGDYYVHIPSAKKMCDGIFRVIDLAELDA